MGLKKDEWPRAVGISSPAAGQTTSRQSEVPPTVARQEMSKQKFELGYIGTSFSKDYPGDRRIKLIFPELQQAPTVSSEIRSTHLPAHVLPPIFCP